MPYPFRDQTFHFQTLRALGCANHGGADANEIFELCKRIRNRNLDDWFCEWSEAGERAFRHGTQSASIGDSVSAKEAFLRATNYLRTAEFFRRDNAADDKEAIALYDRHREAFARAMAVSPDIDYEPLAIPFEGMELPAYVLTPKSIASRNGVVILSTGGYDGTKEEAFFGFGAPALARGYTYVAFDGPGQGEVIRHQRVTFRPDWNIVVTAMVDGLIAQGRVDGNKLVLVGISFGGWLAAQSLTKERRFAAAVLDDGVLDFQGAWRNKVPRFVWGLLDRGHTSLVSTLVKIGTRSDVGRRWGYQNGLWTFGLRTGAELLNNAGKYSLTSEQLQDIQTPLLVFDPQHDQLMKGQAFELVQRLPRDLVTHIILETRHGAGEHCEKGAQGEHDRVLFNWLAQHILGAGSSLG